MLSIDYTIWYLNRVLAAIFHQESVRKDVFTSFRIVLQEPIQSEHQNEHQKKLNLPVRNAILADYTINSCKELREEYGGIIEALS